jgi:hypothetical protein
VIDLIEGLRGHGPESSLWVTPADPHPNGKANALIAAQMEAWILANAKTTSSGATGNLGYTEILKTQQAPGRERWRK